MKKKLIAAMLAVSIGTASFGAVLPVEAIGLGGMIKGGAIGLVIDKYGRSIKKLLYKLLYKKKKAAGNAGRFFSVNY